MIPGDTRITVIEVSDLLPEQEIPKKKLLAKLEEEATLHSCIAIFGKTIRQSAPVALLAEKVYDHYSIPFLTIVFVKSGDQYLLSSLAPTKYSQMSDEERSLLGAYLTHQDFL